MAWSAEQRRNANVIISVGKNMGMSWRDIQIGLMTAMQESSLRNLHWGDRDSAGLFQQRPSQGWGSFEQVTNPQYAAHKFFSTLKSVKGRDSMPLTRAAQAVQRSAFPDAYAKWTSAAMGLVNDARKSGVKIVGNGGNYGMSLGANGQVLWDDSGAKAPAYLGTGGDSGGGGGGSADGGPQLTPLEQAGTTPANAGLAATTDSMSSMAPGIAAATAGSAYPTSPTPAELEAQNALPTGDMPTFANHADYQAGFSDQSIPFQQGVDNTHNGVVQYAKQFLGTPYVWGGTNLNRGVDCSGFVQAVYKHFGVNLPRISYQQANSGTRVPLKALRPGDLVGWDLNNRNPGADHIAIYAGHGQVIEAPRPGIGVRIRKLGSNEGAFGVRLHH